jgi:hypothetical protein
METISIGPTVVTVETMNKWIHALRSGEYEQTQYRLQSADSESFCCMGVACKIFIPEENQVIENGILRGASLMYQAQAPAWLRRINADVQDKIGVCLISLNDDENCTFDEIADILEAIYVHKVLD